MQIPRYLRTIRHLGRSQVLWRLRYLAERRMFPNCANMLAEAAPEPGSLRAGTFCLPLKPVRQGLDAERFGLGVFQILNREIPVGREHPAWRLGPCAVDRLETVTLHYHEWAHGMAAMASSGGADGARWDELFVHYVGGWIRQCGAPSRETR